ncbi:MAG: magnesium transporter [Planctomycetales bacterium]|nr:magnesium transporter [Planctomycetales bacterium]
MTVPNDPNRKSTADSQTSHEFAPVMSLERQLPQLVDHADVDKIEQLLEHYPNHELVRAVSLLDDHARGKLIDLIAPELAADLVEQLPTVQAVQLLEEAEPDHAAAVVNELPSDLQADLLSDLDEDDAEAILLHMEPTEAQSARELQQYNEYEAGGLMVTELLRYPDSWTVQDVINDLQAGAEKYRDYQIQYAYVTDGNQFLRGVLRLRDLLLGSRSQVIRNIMIPSPLSVRANMSLEELHGFFQQHHFLGVPVTGDNGQLVGVVQRADVDQAWIEIQDRSFLRRQGILRGEEIRVMPIWERAQGRLVWLSLNIVLNLLAASIISRFESTLAAVIALAAFLPIISDMSGCSGNQAVAVSIRELMLGLVKPRDAWRVWIKEVSVGLINGMVVGVLLGVIATIWKGNWVLGLVVGMALTINTLVAVSIGGLIPLLLRRLGKDPAVASGPLLTTVTDMCGFFLVLSLASAWLEYLK